MNSTDADIPALVISAAEVLASSAIPSIAMSTRFRGLAATIHRARRPAAEAVPRLEAFELHRQGYLQRGLQADWIFENGYASALRCSFPVGEVAGSATGVLITALANQAMRSLMDYNPSMQRVPLNFGKHRAFRAAQRRRGLFRAANNDADVSAPRKRLAHRRCGQTLVRSR